MYLQYLLCVQVGMLGHHELQKILMYLDMNISEAIMMAMDDSPRIYDEVSSASSTSGPCDWSPEQNEARVPRKHFAY